MTLIILLFSLSLSSRVITYAVLVVSATIIVGISTSLVSAYSFNTSFPKAHIIKGYLKFYK